MRYLTIITFFYLIIISCSQSVNFIPQVNDPLIHTEKKNEFSLLTLNIQALFGKDENKLDALLSYINNEDYDFVVMQEVFNEDTRNYLIKNTDSTKYISIVSRADYHSFPEFLYQDAGLFIKSKFPQIDLSDIDFGRGIVHSEGAIHQMLGKQLSITTDFLANKSILGSLYELNDSTFLFLLTTHLQAIGSRLHKQKQLRQIKRFIQRSVYHMIEAKVLNSPEQLIVILAGDFNADAYDQDDVEMIKKHLGNPVDLHKLFNKENEEYTMNFKLFNFYKRFDYIFTYDSLDRMALKKLNVESVNVTDIKNDSNQSVSDHLAIKANFTFD